MSDELPKEVREAVVYLVAAGYDAGKHGATDSSSVRDASKELGFALARHITAELAAARLQLSAIRWRKVSEKLPENLQRVLVYDGDVFLVAAYLKAYGFTGPHRFEVPTHWMPLPSPPSDTEPGTP